MDQEHATIDTTFRDLETGGERTVTQTITRDGDELVYTVPDGDHEVRVDAAEYVGTLRELTGL